MKFKPLLQSLVLPLGFAALLASCAQSTTAVTPDSGSPAAQSETAQANPEGGIPGIQAEVQPDVPYVPTPEVVVQKMLEMGEVDANDVVYDLGSGDGRLVITAAREFGAQRAVGIEIMPRLVEEANANAEKAGVADRVEFRQQDLFEADFSEASVVTLYLLPEVNLRLRPQLLSQLKPGTIVISHAFDMGDWAPEETVRVEGPNRVHTLYKWTVPERSASN
jgi:SAM-dependent methyltransferase